MTDPAGWPPAHDPLPLPVVDNHTHLDLSRDGEAALELDQAIDRARAVGVDRMVQIGCDLPGARFAAAAAHRHTCLLAGVAIHPNEAPRLGAGLPEAWAEIEVIATQPRVRAVGETGLDYFRTGEDGRAVQQESFRWHIDLAKRLGLALQIHDRDAHEDVLAILDQEGPPPHTVLHCYSGDIEMARECVARGYYLSFSGTVTFKNARPLRNALSVTPLDQVLVETDAPYLAPTPHRGAPNSPYLLPYTVRTMAGVLGVDVPALCRAVSATSERVYGRWATG